MTLPSNARLAGTAYLLYIATGIGSMAAPAQVRPVLGTVMAFCALTLGATLYAITRHVDSDLALLVAAVLLAKHQLEDRTRSPMSWARDWAGSHTPTRRSRNDSARWRWRRDRATRASPPK